jgi:hypothetical protein
LRASKDDSRARSPSFETPRNCAAPQDDGGVRIANEKWPLAGPFPCRASLFVMAMLDDHDLAVMMTPAFMPAVIAMHLGAGAENVMIAAALDDSGFSTCN